MGKKSFRRPLEEVGINQQGTKPKPKTLKRDKTEIWIGFEQPNWRVSFFTRYYFQGMFFDKNITNIKQIAIVVIVMKIVGNSIMQWETQLLHGNFWENWENNNCHAIGWTSSWNLDITFSSVFSTHTSIHDCSIFKILDSIISETNKFISSSFKFSQ